MKFFQQTRALFSRQMNRQLTRRLLMAAMVVAIFTLLSMGFYLYRQNLSDRLLASTEKTLSEITTQQKFNIDAELSAEATALQNIALAIASFSENPATVLKMLGEMRENTGFDYFLYANTDGQGYMQDGQPVDISQRPYLPLVVAGQTVLSEPVSSLLGDYITIPLATPVIEAGEVTGVLVGSFSPASLEKFMLPSFSGQAYSFVVNVSGELILSAHQQAPSRGNLFETLAQAHFSTPNGYDQLVSDIAAGRSGKVTYVIEGVPHFAEYQPLQHNGWSMVVAVPSDVIANDATAITHSVSALIVLVTFCFGLLLLLILWMQHRNTTELRHIAFVDDFSGAPTLACFRLEAQRYVEDHPGKQLMLAKFDIKQFKLINQILGDDVGDRVIRAVAAALAANTPGKYIRYARQHDDEFVVLHSYDQAHEVLEIRDRFLGYFAKEMGPDFHYPVQMISGHYYMSTENCTNIAEALEKANIAHRRAKRTGTEVCVYDQTLIQQLLRQRGIESRMHDAMAAGEFKVYLQPKYALSTEVVAGAEALVRWVNSDGAVTYPGDFIPIFEQNGFILTLDFYMFEETCKILRHWLEEGRHPVPVSVNFSRLHLFDEGFVHHLCLLADQYAIPHGLLEVELTESVMFGQETLFLTVLEELHHHGFILSMDDFGAGYSSLGLLKNLPVDVLKIDRSFFSSNQDKLREKSIIESIMALAKKLGIYTVAEGVEEQQHIDLLREVGCDMVQGYYYARPMPADQFDALLST